MTSLAVSLAMILVAVGAFLCGYSYAFTAATKRPSPPRDVDDDAASVRLYADGTVAVLSSDGRELARYGCLSRWVS